MSTAATTLTPSLQTRTASLGLTTRSVILTLLGLLTFLGVVSAIARLFLGLGATTALTDGYSWGIWIGFDFSLIAFSGAGFTLALISHVLRMEKYHPAVRPAVLAGFLGYTAVLLLLVLDLGRPDRFYHFILYLNLHSPLLEISWCVLLYTTVLVIENSPLALEWLDKMTRYLAARPSSGVWRWLKLAERPNWRRYTRIVYKIMTPVAILGVTLSSLHQSTLGTLYLNMPHRLQALWFSPYMSVLFFVSSATSGISVAILAYLIAARIHRDEPAPEVVDGLGRIVGWVTVLYIALKLADWALAGEIPMLFAFDRYSLLTWVEMGIGAILPAVLLLVPRLRSNPRVRWLAPLLVIFGVLANRFDATLFAQLPPAWAQPYTPNVMEWLSTFGILSLAALAWYLGVQFLTGFEGKGHTAHH